MEKRDKSYYVNIDGEAVRVRASKTPSKSTIEALSALAKAVRNKFKKGWKKGLKVSENWSCRYSYEELKERTEFVFRFKGMWENAPILKLREPIEGMDLIQISYDYNGIVNGSEGKFYPPWGGQIEDLSKDVDQFVYDYLIKEKAIHNDKWQPYKPTMI